jgi:DNA-binding FadR family transcriptional regulator
VHSAPHSEDPVPAHRAVLDAVRDQDPQAAEAAMRALLDQAGRDLDRLDDSEEEGSHVDSAQDSEETEGSRSQ